MSLISIFLMNAAAFLLTGIPSVRADSDVVAPPKASLIFKETPTRKSTGRGPASETQTEVARELADHETEADFCLYCPSVSLFKADSLKVQSQNILDAAQKGGTP